MTDIPAVSVVIPLYNKGPYIARALNSVLAQTFQDFEVIVVDDGSTDEGAEIVRGFDDPRIRLIQQENRGVSAARNRGIEAARAELVAFLDADDEWLPGFLETIMRLRRLYPEAGLYGTAYEENVLGSIIQRIHDKQKGDRLISYFSTFIKYEYSPFCSSSFAASKDVLIQVGGYPTGIKFNEDGTLFGKIALKFPVAYSPKICSTYYKFTKNSSFELVNDYLEEPFSQYISTISKEKLLVRDDREELLEYCQYCKLANLSRNIYSGYGSRTRSELASVKSPRYGLKKYKILFMSYVPLPIMNIIRAYSKILSYLKHKVIRYR